MMNAGGKVVDARCPKCNERRVTIHTFNMVNGEISGDFECRMCGNRFDASEVTTERTRDDALIEAVVTGVGRVVRDD